ncbi:ATP-dependent DNA helicase RecG [Candidatus Dojkabacteria bacterium]|uniref:ATP-dependent DNA helicase RecG n=1 Tax=Candidatus Dojkabacteria bacterium TaxID=2099670 RepID=A0A5C7J6G9_9BACT|nr:MAG: ATP-dependent DNA helicase RecG [Candidatus Dojkabacteria bacterium]
MPSLKSSIRAEGGIYKRYASFLEKLGITKFEDFLFHIPFRYEDYTIISTIARLQPGETVTIHGTVEDIKNQYTRNHFTIQRAKVKDETGIVELVWFNQPYFTRAISVGDKVAVSGKVEGVPGKIQIKNPDYEVGESNFIHTGRLVPIYNETRGVSSKWIRRQTWKLINENANELDDYIPNEILLSNKLDNLKDAITKIHFPENLDEVEKSKKRLSFDEFFLLQLAANSRKREWRKKLKASKFEVEKNTKAIEKLKKSLPFKLTDAQERAIGEIFKDMSSEKPMNRLLEGDVGSGKTVVAAISMYLAYLNGFQSVIMAPTEILAGQHYKTIRSILEATGVKIALATSSKKENTEDFDILIGTHAVIQKKIKYKKLGLVIIDEQQRFGVEQRAILRDKGKNPHLLTMTATPIPRTIALTMYGDLDLSILDELPKGRKEIKTWIVPNVKRASAYEWIKKQINENKSQMFIVCPFIEESETMQGVKAAKKEFETLQNKVFKDYKLNLLHGKIKAKEKDQILADFKDQKFDILVATPVVEVGIDIPNADIIIIETSERFGLSQLHQLRGRVGRNDRQAYCLLFTDSENPETNSRLKAMEKTNIGAELAELDLKIRGAGEIYGTNQSGRGFLKIAQFSDTELIQQTKKSAEKYIEEIENFSALKSKVEELNVKLVSPD